MMHLKRRYEKAIAETVLAALDQGSWLDEEMIPGLMYAAYLLAEKNAQSDILIEEAQVVWEDGFTEYVDEGEDDDMPLFDFIPEVVDPDDEVIDFKGEFVG